jgi:hypothetical protein
VSLVESSEGFNTENTLEYRSPKDEAGKIYQLGMKHC